MERKRQTKKDLLNIIEQYEEKIHFLEGQALDLGAVIKKIKCDSLKEYLILHERDIAIGINDFSDLRELFIAVFYREPHNQE